MTRTAAQAIPATEVSVGDLARGSDAMGGRWHEVTGSVVRPASPGRRFVHVSFADRHPADFPEDFEVVVRREVP